ncbi:acyl carrier protein [Sphingorhabdus sp. EL138]|jgi:acyl carrier protein|uniref:acyl carrier protein n=1 Tax=Sphingorhabdus sp. EL138 TaxID=2073156 RepID=UPI000D68E73E|nr:acyl carrier protein [Sphingorhabdus sp. EL138]
MEKIVSEVREIISSICEIDQEDIGLDVNLIEELEIDSIDFMDVTYEIDQKYGIKLPVEGWMEKVNNQEAKISDYFIMSKLCKSIEVLISEK